MVKKTYIPDRRDIVWMELDPTKGHESNKRRPALVLTPKTYNQKTSMAIMCPITSQIKEYPFEVRINEKNIDGAVLSDQVRALDWKARNATLIQKASTDVYKEVTSKLELLISG